MSEIRGTPVADADALWARVRNQRDAKAAGDAEAEAAELPAPEVPRRPAAPEEIPKTLRSLIKAAEANGWDVEATYARGTPIDADGLPVWTTRDEVVIDPDSGGPALTPTGRPKVRKIPVAVKVVDSVAVRLRKPGRYMVAVYEDGKPACAYRVRPVTEAATVTELTKEVKGS